MQSYLSHTRNNGWSVSEYVRKSYGYARRSHEQNKQKHYGSCKVSKATICMGLRTGHAQSLYYATKKYRVLMRYEYRFDDMDSNDSERLSQYHHRCSITLRSLTRGWSWNVPVVGFSDTTHVVHDIDTIHDFFVSTSFFDRSYKHERTVFFFFLCGWRND